MSDEKSPLSGFPVTAPVTVQWSDQDALGHVNNVVYFKWFEIARIGYFDQSGMGRLAAESELGQILAATSCYFRSQLSFPDFVQVGVRVSRIGRSSIGMEYAVWSASTREVVADGDSTIVMFNYAENRSVVVPDLLREAIESIEKKSFPRS